MRNEYGNTTFIQYAFHYCKSCKSVEYTDEDKCKKCNNNYILLNDYLKQENK